MTFNSDIEKTEKEIAVLQAKLELLKEIETHKSQPRMTCEYVVNGEIVSYNGKCYVRLDYSYDTFWYISKNTQNFTGNNLTLITDGETRRLLEGLWFNDVRKGKYAEPYCPDEPEYYDEVEWDEKDNPKSPVAEAYKDWWGQYPELETDSEYDDMRWQGFQAGFQAAYEEQVREDDYYDKVVDKMVKEQQAQKLWNIMRDKLGFSIDMCDEIVDAVEEWLPDQQSAAGSQNVDVELLVDGFNDCLRKMKEMLR